MAQLTAPVRRLTLVMSLAMLAITAMPAAPAYDISTGTIPLGRMVGGSVTLCPQQDTTLTTLRSYGNWVVLSPQSTNAGVAHVLPEINDTEALPYQRDLLVTAGENPGGTPLYATLSVRAMDTRDGNQTDLGVLPEPMGSFNVVVLPEESDACLMWNPKQFFMQKRMEQHYPKPEQEPPPSWKAPQGVPNPP